MERLACLWGEIPSRLTSWWGSLDVRPYLTMENHNTPSQWWRLTISGLTDSEPRVVVCLSSDLQRSVATSVPGTVSIRNHNTPSQWWRLTISGLTDSEPRVIVCLSSDLQRSVATSVPGTVSMVPWGWPLCLDDLVSPVEPTDSWATACDPHRPPMAERLVLENSVQLSNIREGKVFRFSTRQRYGAVVVDVYD